METTKVKDDRFSIATVVLDEITQIIESHRDWHPAWILEAIEHYIKTGDSNYDPIKEQRIFYSGVINDGTI